MQLATRPRRESHQAESVTLRWRFEKCADTSASVETSLSNWIPNSFYYRQSRAFENKIRSPCRTPAGIVEAAPPSRGRSLR
jgi:hypothetical protein